MSTYNNQRIFKFFLLISMSSALLIECKNHDFTTTCIGSYESCQKELETQINDLVSGYSIYILFKVYFFFLVDKLFIKFIKT